MNERSPKDDTKLVMRGKDVSDHDFHTRDAPKSPNVSTSRKSNAFSDSTSLIPLQTPGKNPLNRTIRASSPFHEIQDHGEAHPGQDLRSSERTIDSSRGSSVKITSTSPYQASIPGIRTIDAMRTSPDRNQQHQPASKHVNTEHAVGWTNSPTRDHNGMVIPAWNGGWPQTWPQGQAGPSPYPFYGAMPPGGPMMTPGVPQMYYSYYPQQHQATSIAGVELRPNYAAMSDSEKADALAIFDTQFKDMIDKYPHKKFKMFNPKISLNAIHDIYDLNQKSINTDKNASQFRAVLQIIFMAIEFLCNRFLGIDMRKFTKKQMTNIAKYEPILKDIAEKYATPSGGMNVWWRLAIMIILNAVIVAGAKLFSEKTGMDDDEVYDTIAPLTDDYVDGLTTAPVSKVNPLTGTAPVPSPKKQSSWLNMATTMMGLGNSDNLMDTVTNFGGDMLANMDVKDRSGKPKTGPSDPVKPTPAVPKRRRPRAEFE
jgi:hypothetical protein